MNWTNISDFGKNLERIIQDGISDSVTDESSFSL
jgi:hypothetical protein